MYEPMYETVLKMLVADSHGLPPQPVPVSAHEAASNATGFELRPSMRDACKEEVGKKDIDPARLGLCE